MPNTEQRPEAIFFNPEDFIQEIKEEGKQVRLRTNEKTGKKSVAIGGQSFKAQETLDTSKPMAFYLEKGKSLDEACLINVNSQLKEEIIDF